MKGFFSWFKQKTKMKRWIFLTLVGILLCCYGMATILTSKQIEFGNLAKIIVIFVIGFICVVVYVRLYRGTKGMYVGTWKFAFFLQVVCEIL